MDGKLKGGVLLNTILLRLKGGVRALETYIQHNPHLMAELRTFLDLHTDKIAGVMSGLAATLEPFCKGQIPQRLGGHGQSIDLERVFLEPTLLYIGIPQADVVQGVGALVMQLVKRLVDEVGLRVADNSATGQVPIGTGVYLDELLNLGKLNKLENMLATLRSRGIAYVLGVQSHDQGRALYGRDVWEAIIKATRHKVVFLGALDPKDALEVSQALGEMTVFEQTLTASEGENGDRQGTTTKEVKRALVPMEEMRTWQKFHAVVIGRNLMPFKIMCYPLFDARHPDYAFHASLSAKANQLPPLAVAPQSSTPTLEHPALEKLELAQLIYRAVAECWDCELYRERGRVVMVRLVPLLPFTPPNISNINLDGKHLELQACERIGEELINALIWLKRRTELSVWIADHHSSIKGAAEYTGNPLGELEAETLWMDSSAVAEVFGRAYLSKKNIVKRTIDQTELEVIEVQLNHRGLEKLRARITSLEAEAKLEQGSVS
jgi:hypothetical protein